MEINGFRNDKGDAFVALFFGKEGFPDDVTKALQSLHAEILSGKATVIFSKLPYGEYAVSALHDEDFDGKMNRRLLGQPREGFGFSGRPEYNFGPPSYDDTAFVLVTTPWEIVVPMSYETVREQKQGERRTGQGGKP